MISAQKRSRSRGDDDIEAGIPLNPVPPEETHPQKSSDPDPPTPVEEPFNAYLLEWRTRRFLYTVYFLLALSLSWNCFSVGEGCLTVTGIITLIVLRTVVTDKCDPADVTLTPKSSWRTKCGHYCSWVTCWVMTLITLASFTLVNLVQSRILSSDRDRFVQNCAYAGNNVTMIDNNHSSLSKDLDDGPSRCLIPCDVIYFYPTALLLFDLLFCYTGFFRVLAITLHRILAPMWTSLVTFLTTPPASTVFKVVPFLIWISASVTLIGISVLILTRFGFEEDKGLCIVVAGCIIFWFVGLLIPLPGLICRERNFLLCAERVEEACYVVVALFSGGAFLMTTFVAWAVRTYSDREFTYYEAVRIFDLSEDEESDQDVLTFGRDAEFWAVLAGFSLIYAGCFALANLSNLRKSRLTWTVAAGAFIIPLVPLLLTLGIMAGVYIFVVRTIICSLALANNAPKTPSPSIPDIPLYRWRDGSWRLQQPPLGY